MPNYFSHLICADKIYGKLNKEQKAAIDDHDLYRLGAQGGDVFFAYSLTFSMTNLGRSLHRRNAKELLSSFAERNLSYAAGFATHYALDCTLHPLIYAYESTAKAPLAHLRFEDDLGLYISRRFATPRKIVPKERLLSSTFPLYDCIKSVEQSVTVTGVERCLKRHFAYTRTLYKTKRQDYKCDYDFHSLAGAVDDAVAFGAECVADVLRGEFDDEKFSKSFLEK